VAERDDDSDPERDIPRSPARRSFFQAAAGTAVAGAGLVGGAYVLKEAAERPSNREIARERPETRADIELRVNGKTQRLNVPHQRTLLLALREDLGLTGTKKGCNMAQCGACTVLAAIRRCTAASLWRSTRSGTRSRRLRGSRRTACCIRCSAASSSTSAASAGTAPRE